MSALIIVFYSIVNQMDNVAQDFIVLVKCGCSFRAAALQELFGLSNGLGLKAVGGDLCLGDNGF